MKSVVSFRAKSSCKSFFSYRIVLFNAVYIIRYLLNSHIKQRVIFLTRHGQSEDNVRDQIGGDSSLTPAGVAFAQALNEFVRDHFKPTELEIWTSTLQRAMQTSQPLQSDYRCLRNRLLNEIDGGICEGLTYSDIGKSHYPLLPSLSFNLFSLPFFQNR